MTGIDCNQKSSNNILKANHNPISGISIWDNIVIKNRQITF